MLDVLARSEGAIDPFFPKANAKILAREQKTCGYV
jgi:hypothetical protein